MEVVRDGYKGLNFKKRVYNCSTCKKPFNWDKNSSWYGSYKMLEDTPEKIKYFCSDKCQTIKH